MKSDEVGLRRLLPADDRATADLDDDALAACYENAGASWLRVNFVSSLDGGATRDGRSGGLSDAADRRVFDVLRRLCDVVLVGAGTIRAEGYAGMSVDAVSAQWRTAHGLAAQPRLAIVSNRLALDADDAVFADAVTRPLLITSRKAAADDGVRFARVADIVECGAESVDTGAIAGALAAIGLPRVHCEGGPTLFAALAAVDAVDELCLTLSPLLVGGHGPRITGGAADLTTRMRLDTVLSGEDTLLLRYLAERGADRDGADRNGADRNG